MELLGSHREPLPGARPLGTPSPDEPVEVTLSVRRRSTPAEFQAALEAATGPARGRRFLSRGAFAAAHGAHPDDLGRVRSFAAAHGLAVVGEHPGGRTVSLVGGLRSMEEAFGVRLQRWTHDQGSYRGRTGPIQLPPELSGIVLGVFGLDNRPQARPHFRRRIRATATDRSYPPTAVAAAYAFPPAASGAGEGIAVIELGGGYRSADLAAFFGGLGMPVPSIEAVPVDGAANAPTGDPNGPDAEVELDLEVAGSCAPGAQLTAYFAPNTDRGFLDAVVSAIHNPTRTASIVSISWGGPEPAWTPQATAAFESAFQDAAVLGVTVTAAAGDGGATDGGTAGTLEVDFPASSPYVVAAGGTRLLLSGTEIESEVVWNDLASGDGATGGGVSRLFPRPAYQAGVRVPLAPTGGSGRGVPDVAGDADPTTGYAVIVDGSPSVIGGTSAVAPLWAALFARLNQALGRPLGFANPLLYRPAEEATFHGIVSGSNGGYSAGPGWNPCAGWGSPDGTTLLAALRASLSLP